MTLSPSQYETFERLGTLTPIPQQKTRMERFRDYLNRMRQQPPQQQPNFPAQIPQRKPILTSEQIRANIKATNLLSGTAWKDRTNRGRISLMGSDRQKQQQRQQDEYNRQIQNQIQIPQQPQQHFRQQIQHRNPQQQRRIVRSSLLQAIPMVEGGGCIGFNKPSILPKK